jgi:hypothetical protein
LVDRNDVAIYVADITYRSDAIQLHIDLLAPARAAANGPRKSATTIIKRKPYRPRGRAQPKVPS